MQVKHCTARTDYAEAANHGKLLPPASNPDWRTFEVGTLWFHTLLPFLEAIVKVITSVFRRTCCSNVVPHDMRPVVSCHPILFVEDQERTSTWPRELAFSPRVLSDRSIFKYSFMSLNLFGNYCD